MACGRSRQKQPSGGAPQLVGLYSNLTAKTFGIAYHGSDISLGLPLPGMIPVDTELEWRDEKFQRVDGRTLELVDGAQRPWALTLGANSSMLE
jgi:hypothetical protein